MAKQETNINSDIRAREVRVIDDEGEMLGVLSLEAALAAAAERGLDLVEVAPNSVPPACRIMDYGKYKYQASKRAAEAKKKTARVEIKEVKMRPKTEEHDYQYKLKNARKFLLEGNKVKLTIMFRGREVTHPELGRKILLRVAEEVNDIAQPESFPSMSGRFMTMMISPLKK
ncbi:MAG: translation initiation factor IF-3 [Desulfuromonadaceae bacterium]|nr:translation initiation factor IF-3 [Desulfuromonadaceae bacterium]